jgi:hypothetical protein
MKKQQQRRRDTSSSSCCSPATTHRAQLVTLLAWAHAMALVFLLESLACTYQVLHADGGSPQHLWAWALVLWAIDALCVLWAVSYAACRRCIAPHALTAACPAPGGGGAATCHCHYAAYSAYAFFYWFFQWTLGVLVLILLIFGQPMSSANAATDVLILAPIGGITLIPFYLVMFQRFYARLPRADADDGGDQRLRRRHDALGPHRDLQSAPVPFGAGGDGASSQI